MERKSCQKKLILILKISARRPNPLSEMCQFILSLLLRHLIRLIGRKDGKIIGSSMEPNYPNGSKYYIKQLEGKLRVDMAVLIAAEPDWFKVHVEQIDFIVKRIDQINVRLRVLLGSYSYDVYVISSS